MKWIRFLPDSLNVESERNLDTIRDLAVALQSASYSVWIEGLGQPMCENDLRMWRTVGRFLADVAEREVKS